MSSLANELREIQQRVGINVGKLRTDSERAAFVTNVRADISNIIYQHNTIVKAIFATLPDGILDVGLDGARLFTDTEATEASGPTYFSPDLARTLTVKESFDVIVGELGRLENSIAAIDTASAYDDSALVSAVDELEYNDTQFVEDVMGPDYVLDGDGAPNLSYPLSQIIDAIGAFFSGFPGTGNTYAGAYPALSFTGSTLQGSYDSGTIDAGAIELENAKGHIVIKDDSSGALDVYLEWENDSNVSKGQIDVDGLHLRTNATRIKMDKKASDPVDDADTGMIYVKDDADSKAELYYRNDDGGDVATQVTRGGRVTEKEIGCDWFPATSLSIYGGAPFVSLTIGTPPATDMMYQIVECVGAVNETVCYGNLLVPVDEDGFAPSRMRLTILAGPSTNPASNGFYTLTLFTNDSTAGSGSDIELISSGMNAVPVAWGSAGGSTPAEVVMPGHLYRIDEHTYDLDISGSGGLVPFKIKRDPLAGSDTFTGNVAIYGVRITWWR